MAYRMSSSSCCRLRRASSCSAEYSLYRSCSDRRDPVPGEPVAAGRGTCAAAEGGLGQAALSAALEPGRRASAAAEVVGERDGEWNEEPGVEAAERATSDQPRRIGVPAPDEAAGGAGVVGAPPSDDEEATEAEIGGTDGPAVDVRRLEREEESPDAGGGEAGEDAVGHRSGLISGTGSLVNAAPVEPYVGPSRGLICTLLCRWTPFAPGLPLARSEGDTGVQVCERLRAEREGEAPEDEPSEVPST